MDLHTRQEGNEMRVKSHGSVTRGVVSATGITLQVSESWTGQSLVCVLILYVMTTWEGVLKLMLACLPAAAA